MKNITSKKQLFLDFGRDYDASLSNFFFSKANEIIKNEIHLLMQSNDKNDLFIYGENAAGKTFLLNSCLLYTSPSPRDAHESRMPSSA